MPILHYVELPLLQRGVDRPLIWVRAGDEGVVEQHEDLVAKGFLEPVENTGQFNDVPSSDRLFGVTDLGRRAYAEALAQVPPAWTRFELGQAGEEFVVFGDGLEVFRSQERRHAAEQAFQLAHAVPATGGRAKVFGLDGEQLYDFAPSHEIAA